MKRNERERESSGYFLITAIIVMSCALQLLSCLRSAGASIVDTKHNLSYSGPGTVKAASPSETRICVFCHTPHNAIPGAPPLWNHTLSAATYTVASSSLPGWTSLLSSPQNPPDGDSRLCLSCHDGTVAIGSVVNLGGQPTTITMQGVDAGGKLSSTSSANIGTDLSGHHPVSIEVDDALLADKDTQCTNNEVSFKLCYPQAPVVLRPTNNQYGGPPHTGKGVQCSSCHDAHSSNEYFLRLSDFSALCTNCHFFCGDACPP
jgi:predicted CXXCH cytochrome family protein